MKRCYISGPMRGHPSFNFPVFFALERELFRDGWVVSNPARKDIEKYPHVKRWRDRIAARPAVQRGVAVLAERRRQTPGFSKEQAEVLFGATQYVKR